MIDGLQQNDGVRAGNARTASQRVITLLLAPFLHQLLILLLLLFTLVVFLLVEAGGLVTQGHLLFSFSLHIYKTFLWLCERG